MLRSGLALRPGYAAALFNRANALQQLQRFAEALESYDRALALQPNEPTALTGRGLVLQALGRPAEALESYDRALALRPDDAGAMRHRGDALEALERPAEALESYDRALALRPDFRAALLNRAGALQGLGRFADALQSYDRALAMQPDDAAVLNNRGHTLQSLERPAEALESYDRALAIRPDYAAALCNRGNTLQALGRSAEALENYDRALALEPDFAVALSNRGNALQELKRFPEALESYERALAVTPDFPDCQVNRAWLLLLIGRFAEGWQAYEWRRTTRNGTVPPAGPEWSKGDTAAKRLLLYCEQGFGDSIQFSRFARVVAANGAEVFLQVQPPLGRLLSRLEGVRVIREGEALPEYDAHLPVMSLPHVLGIIPAAMPTSVPYLFAEPDRIAAWAERLPADRFRVGIVWQGRPVTMIDKGRSIPLRAFAALCRIPGLTLISLQKGDGVEQLADLPPRMRVETLGADFDPGPDAFLDSAAVMMNLDLVISCDTANAHLAGALGRPVWIVLKHVPEWRWMMDREDTPWYPTARLFRQTRPRDWDEVFERVAVELARAVAAK